MSRYVFTPARAAALAKARAVRSAKAKTRRNANRRHYSGDINKRGKGYAGLKKNTIPYVRVNKRSQTLGVNAGTVLPGGKKRIVAGGYVRIENVGRKGAIDTALARGTNVVAPYGTRRRRIGSVAAKFVKIQSPGSRISAKGHTVSLGTSRGAGPTVIVRRGSKPTPLSKSRKGIKAYDKRMSVIAGQRVARKAKRKKRAQRRKK